MRVSHVTLCVSNWERSLRFYHDVLGFHFVADLELRGEHVGSLARIPGAEVQGAVVERDGLRLELRQFTKPDSRGAESPAPANQLGLSHLSMRVDDLTSTLEWLEEAGVDVLHTTRVEVPPGGFGKRLAGGRAICVADPDGLVIELVETRGD
ncbi:VOC family protein [Myxococcota bacterium]|nr:VOC family protein [Myxococcota bacterium]